jgi:hypothetical protein
MGKWPACSDFLEHLPRMARVFAGCDVAGWCNVIEQMMRGTGSFGGSGLGGPDVKLAVHGDGIAVHDLAIESLCKHDGNRGLPTSRGTDHNHEQRFRLRRSHCQRMLQ